MKIIGFRCWDDRYAFVVLSGTQENPEVIVSGHRMVPKGVTRPQELSWLRKDVQEVLQVHQPDDGGLRTMEPSAKTKSMPRAQFDGVVLEAACSHGDSLELAELAKSQLKSRMQLKGSVSDDQWTEIFARLKNLAKTNFFDAGLVAIAMLPRS